MQLEIQLDKDFEEEFLRLKEIYPKEMFELEGLTEDKLDPTRFFKTFIHSDNVANASIDDNSNVNDTNINIMLNESNKPFNKLLAFNKVFIEMKELFDIDTAKKWLSSQISGSIYTHDPHLLSFYAYSYFSKETVLVKYKDILHYIAFEDLYTLVDEPVFLLNKTDEAYCKYTNDLVIYDEGDKWTRVIRVIKKPKKTKMNFIKATNGLSQIVTSNHPIITTTGDIEASNITNDHILKTERPKINYGDISHLYFSDAIKDKKGILLNGVDYSLFIGDKTTAKISYKSRSGLLDNKLILDNDLGWVIGLLLAEGNVTKYGINLSQNDGLIYDKLISILLSKNIQIYSYKNSKCNKIHINSTVLRNFFVDYLDFDGHVSYNKKLPSDFLKFNREFLLGIIGGLIDGDGSLNRNSKRNISIRITSRTLLNQISFIIQNEGYTVRDYIPVSPSTVEIKKEYVSFKLTKTLFGIAFTPTIDGTMFNSVKINSRDVQYSTLEKTKKMSNSRYTFEYGNVNVCNNVELSLDNEKFVYDISTETEQFIQNNIVSHNCFAFSVKSIAEKGLYFIKEMSAEAPNHLSTYNRQILQFISYASNQQAGAVGLPDYLLYSYYFWQKDVKSGYIPEQIKDTIKEQEFQSTIFDLNQPFMKVTQSAYTNFTILDREYFVGLFGGLTFPDGSFAIDHIEQFMQYQKDWLNFVKKLRAKKSFTFPVITTSCLYDKESKKFKDEDTVKFVVNHNMTWGDSNIYISNSIDTLASCCRLLNNLEDINKGKLEGHFNSIGGSDLNIGSTKVITINLPRVGYKSKGDFTIAKELIKDIVELIHKTHFAHRLILKKNIDRGQLPLYTFGLMNLDKQFATIGITGIMEYIEAMGGIDRGASGVKYNTKGLKLAKETLQYINTLNENTLEKYGFTSNIEQIPSESASIKLCKKDKLLFKDIINCSLYSNQWIALSENSELMERIRVSGKLDSECGGGQILHINTGDAYTNFEQAWKMTNLLAKKGIIYYSDIRKINYCKNDHNFFTDKCPECGSESIGQIVKIVGYMTKSAFYKKERKDELNNRKFYDNDIITSFTNSDDITE